MDSKNIVKEYSNGEVTIVWQAGKCMHSGNCVRNLPAVFKPQEHPWITISNASSLQIIETVHKCPSSALSIKKER